jgi:hypothetical protein
MQISQTETTSASDAVLPVIATCPSRMQAVGGGWRTTISTTRGSKAIVVSSRARLPSAWEVDAREGDTPGGAVTAYALCQRLAARRAASRTNPKALRVKKVSAIATVPESDVGSATATCPDKLRAIGGGFSVPTPLGQWVLPIESLRVSRRSWRASAYVLYGWTSTVRVYVYCARLKRSATGSTAAVAPVLTEPGSVASSCQAGSHLAALGYTQSPSFTGSSSWLVLSELAPIDPLTARATGVQLGSNPTPLTTVGYCG